MTPLDPTDPAVWRQVRTTVARTNASSRHCAIATTGPDGHPHVTPIGSVMVAGPGRLVYLDVYNVELGRNLDRDPRCTVLAVDSAATTWLGALLRGRFSTPPGVRLQATAGPSRPATSEEVARFQRAVRPARRTRGGHLLWGRLTRVRARDLTVDGVVPVTVPRMTAHLWPETVRGGAPVT